MDRKPEPFDLGDLLLGTATSAAQVEGGVVDDDWSAWASAGHVKDGSHPRRANDHWERVVRDTVLLHSLGVQTHRLGLSWARLEPRPGEWDEAAVQHYRQELAGLRESGIRPLVTLYHFAHPTWFDRLGGWEGTHALERFQAFVRGAVARLGDLCEDWITINEPNVQAYQGWGDGTWPPGKRDTAACLRVMRTLARAHARAYGEVHQVRRAMGLRDTRVGAAHHLRVFDGAGGPLDGAAAALTAWTFQGAMIEATTTGRFLPPLGLGDAPEGAGCLADFLGVNYYSRDLCRFEAGNPGGLFCRQDHDPALPKSDLGWDLYPEGLYRLCRDLWRRHRRPVWITENGICDRTDALRPRFLHDHLAQVARLRGEGVPVERYYHWTLMDNFEWLEGEGAPFGLVKCDFATQRRTVRRSGRFFGEIVRARGVTRELIAEFLEDPVRPDARL